MFHMTCDVLHVPSDVYELLNVLYHVYDLLNVPYDVCDVLNVSCVSNSSYTT